MKKLYFISQIVMFTLVIIGISVVAISSHELKHFYDVKDNSKVTELCVLNIPTEYKDLRTLLTEPSGYTEYIPNSKKVVESSEFQALIVSIIVFIILFIFIIIYIKGYFERGIQLKAGFEE